MSSLCAWEVGYLEDAASAGDTLKGFYAARLRILSISCHNAVRSTILLQTNIWDHGSLGTWYRYEKSRENRILAFVWDEWTSAGLEESLGGKVRRDGLEVSVLRGRIRSARRPQASTKVRLFQGACEGKKVSVNDVDHDKSRENQNQSTTYQRAMRSEVAQYITHHFGGPAPSPRET